MSAVTHMSTNLQLNAVICNVENLLEPVCFFCATFGVSPPPVSYWTMATRETSNEIETWKPIYLEGDKRVNVGDGNFSCLTLLQAMGVMKMNKDGIAWRSKAGQGVTVVGTEIRSGEWRRVSRLFQLRLVVKGGVSYKFDGFKEQVCAP